MCPGDWIITGVAGERYPCKPAIFEATYEAVPDFPSGGPGGAGLTQCDMFDDESY